MGQYYELCKIAVMLFGPLMLACVVVIYASVAIRTHKLSPPAQALYLYVTYNMQARKHMGIMSYLLFACTFFFLAALACLVIARLSS